MRLRIVSLLSSLLIVVNFSATANTPTLVDADKLFDFAQTAEPSLFFPPAQTQQITEAGSDWYFRFYTGSGTYAAININGSDGFLAGNVYLLGPQFGEAPLLVDTLTNLLAAVDAANPAPEPIANSITNPGSSVCTERKFPAQNDTATFRTTRTIDGSSQAVSRTEFYELVSDSKTITVIEETAVVNGMQTITSNRLSSYYETNGPMYFTTGSDSVITVRSAGFITSNQDSNVAYSPALFIGPPDQLCVGQQWFAASVTQTVTTDPVGNGPVVTQTQPTTVTVDSIGATVSVRGGTYETIQTTTTYPDRRIISWNDLQFGVLVKSETYEGASEVPTIIDELIGFELPF